MKPYYKRRIIYSGYLTDQSPKVHNVDLEFPSWFISPSGKNKYIRVNRVMIANSADITAAALNGPQSYAFPTIFTFHSDFNTEPKLDNYICKCNEEFSDSYNYMYEYNSVNFVN